MNILQINTVDFRGGAAQVAYNLKKFYENSGHRVNFFVQHKTMDDKNIFYVNDRFDFGKASKISKKIIKKDLPSYVVFKTRDILRFVIANDFEFFKCNIFNTKEYQEADVIHCHNLHGNYFNLELLEKISKEKPIVWTLHDMWAFTGHCSYSYKCECWQSECRECPDLSIYPPLFWDNTKNLLKKKKKIYNNSNLHIVTPSKWLIKKVKKSILKNQNLQVIPNGIDTGGLRQHDKGLVREKLNLPKNKKIIMFLAAGGVRDSRKGWEYIDEVRRKYSDVLFLCVGNKNKEGRDCNIMYLKYIDSRKLLAKYFSAVDVFLFTSLAENFPLVILEAMACGVPIVSFDVGGVKEAMIHKENGYIAEYKDINDLINGIEYIFKLNKEEQKKISINSRKRIENNYTLDIMTDNYLKLYKRLLNEQI